MKPNVLDIVLFVLLLWFAITGLLRGFIRQAFGLGGVVAGHLLGIIFYEPARKLMGLTFPYAEAVGYVAVFVASYLLVRLLGMVVEGWIRKSKLSGPDRLGGFLLGSLKWAVLATLAVFMLVALLPPGHLLIQRSFLAPHLLKAAEVAERLFPEKLGASFRDKVEQVKKGASSIPALPAGGPFSK